MKRHNRKTRAALAALLAFVVATAAYAFTASNTVPASKAGDGESAISGYVVSNVKYNLDTTNPANLASVQFDLDAAAATAKAKVVSTGSFVDCSNTAGNSWTCPLTGTSVLSANQLRVIAVQ